MIDYDLLAATYAQHRGVNGKVLAELIRATELHSGLTVLEVGCGTGNYSIALAAETGCFCHGIDPSMQMLAVAREQGTGIEFLQGKAESLPFGDESFDLVFSVDVIHHVSDREAYHSEAYRVLRHGGWLCTVTDSEEIIRRREILSVYFPETVEAELRRYPPIPWLRAVMAQAGFSAIHEQVVETKARLTDLSAIRTKAYSCLHLIPKEAFQRGIARLEEAMIPGGIGYSSRYLLLWGVK